MADEDFQRAFENFARDGKLSPDSIKKWFKISTGIGMRLEITKAEVKDVIIKSSSRWPWKKSFDFARLNKCINILAKEKKVDPQKIMTRLTIASDIKTAFDFYATKEDKLAPDYAKKWFKEVAIFGDKIGITEADLDCLMRVQITEENKGFRLIELRQCIRALAKEKKVHSLTLLKKLAKAEGLKPAYKCFAAVDGKLCLDCIKKWFKEADIIGDDTGITEADLGVAFTKIRKSKKTLDFAGLKEFINTLSREKEVAPNKLNEKLAAVGAKRSKEASVDVGAKVAKDEKEK